MIKFLATALLISVLLVSCSESEPLYHPDPDGSTVVQLYDQAVSINHFPNKTYVKGVCYFLTKDDNPKSDPIINTEEPYQNGCAGG